jgi:hypothetical protein
MADEDFARDWSEAEEVPDSEAEREDRRRRSRSRSPGPPPKRKKRMEDPQPTGGLYETMVPCLLDDEPWDHNAEIKAIVTRLAQMNSSSEIIDADDLWDTRYVMDLKYCFGCDLAEELADNKKLHDIFEEFLRRDIWKMTWKKACQKLEKVYNDKLRMLPCCERRNWSACMISKHYIGHAQPEAVTMLIQKRKFERMIFIDQNNEGLEVVQGANKGRKMVNQRDLLNSLKLMEEQRKCHEWINKYMKGK